MNHQSFDDNIKANLESFEVPYDADSWRTFEQKLDSKLEQADIRFDQSLRTVLHQVETPYDSDLWKIMARKLDQTASIRKVRFFKLAEAAVILLLAIQLESTLQYENAPELPLKSTLPATLPTQTPMAGLRDTQVPVNPTSIRSSEGSGRFLSSVRLLSDGEEAVSPTGVRDSSTEYTSETKLQPENSALFYRPASEVFSVPPFISTLSPSLTRFLHPGPSYSPNAARSAFKKSVSKWFIAAFGEGSRVSVRRSNQSPEKQVHPGVGVFIGKVVNKWAVETGIQVSSTNFTPESKSVVFAGSPQTGFLASRITEADATIITVPLRASREIASSGAFELRALAGVAAELISEKRFARSTSYLPPAGQSTGGGSIPFSSIPDKAQNGLFEGGKLTGNSSVSAELGLRIKADFGAAYSVFIEPVSLIHLSGGWGPQQEKIDRFSVRAGVYTRL